MSDETFLALNKLTGRVHEYNGTAPGGIGSDKNDFGIGIIPCGCEGFEEAVENDMVMAIQRDHLERGIWEPADCLAADE